MPSAMLTYVLASVPSGTKSYLGSPDETALATVLADALTTYGVASEALVTDTQKFNAIGRALFWQWAVEYVTAASFVPSQGFQSEYTAHIAEIKALRDYYAALANSYGGGASIILGDTTLQNDPYAFPRFSDRT